MDNRAILPFRAVGFRGDSEVVSARTYVPAPSWSSVPPDLPEEHVLRLLEPAFRDDDPQRAADTATRWLDQGVLATDPEPALYVSRTSDARGETLGVASLVDLEAGVLRPHEEIIASYAIRQARLAEATRAQWEPITAYTTTTPVAPVLAGVVGAPALRTADGDGRRDEIWAVTDPDLVAAITATLARQPLIIADGHHRYAAWRTAPARSGRLALTVALDAGAVEVGPIHRVVAALDMDEALTGLPLPTVEMTDLAAAARFIEVSQTRCVLTDGSRFLGVDAYEAAPTWVEQVFTPHHGLESDAVRYEPDLATAAAKAAGSGGVALLLSTPSLESVTRAATTGRLLPHKSSWFQPKPRVGMIMRRWD